MGALNRLPGGLVADAAAGCRGGNGLAADVDVVQQPGLGGAGQQEPGGQLVTAVVHGGLGRIGIVERDLAGGGPALRLLGSASRVR